MSSHAGWEMDNTAWITEDGDVLTTNHDSFNLYPMSLEDIQAKIDQAVNSLEGLYRAKNILDSGSTKKD